MIREVAQFGRRRALFHGIVVPSLGAFGYALTSLPGHGAMARFDECLLAFFCCAGTAVKVSELLRRIWRWGDEPALRAAYAALFVLLVAVAAIEVTNRSSWAAGTAVTLFLACGLNLAGAWAIGRGCALLWDAGNGNPRHPERPHGIRRRALIGGGNRG